MKRLRFLMKSKFFYVNIFHFNKTLTSQKHFRKKRLLYSHMSAGHSADTNQVINKTYIF